MTDEKTIDLIARYYMIDRSSTSLLGEFYGQGTTAQQNNFGYKFGSTCATYATEMVERNQYNLSTATLLLGSAIADLNDSHFAFAVDSFKKQLINKTSLTTEINGIKQLNDSALDNIKYHMLQKVGNSPSKIKMFVSEIEGSNKDIKRKSVEEQYVDFAQTKSDPDWLKKEVIKADVIARTFILDNNGDTEKLSLNYRNGISANDNAFGYIFALSCVKQAVDIVIENPKNLTKASDGLGRAIINLNDSHFAFALDNFKNTLAEQIPEMRAKSGDFNFESKISLGNKFRSEIAITINEVCDY